MIPGNSYDHLLFFIDKIKKNQPFSLIRPNDGEFMIMNGIFFQTQDVWGYKGGSLQYDLINAVHKCASIANCYIGIPCKDCWSLDKTEWCKQNYHINPDRLTYGNIVCNYNWKPFTNFLKESQIPIYYIGPGTQITNDINVVDRIYTDPFQIERWDIEKGEFIQRISSWIEKHVYNSTTSLFFAFSVGPLTKILISIFSEKYPTHFFLDTGSSIDLFLKGESNRLYIKEDGEYSNIICDFDCGHIIRT